MTRNTGGRATWQLVAVLALLAMVSPLAMDMYLPGFPQMAIELRTTPSLVESTLAVFTAGMGFGQLVWGPLSDSRGRLVPLLIGSGLFAAVSVLAALAPNIGVLLVLRFLQGFCGCAGVVIGRAIARDLATGDALAQLLGVLTVIMSIGPIAAPVAGGLLIGPIGWRGILWVLAGVALVMFAGVARVVPESLPAERRRGGGLRGVGKGFLTVLGDRPYVGYMLTIVFAFAVFFAYVASSSFLLQNEYGLTTLQYTACYALNAAGMVLGGIVNARLVVHHPARRIVRVAITSVLLASLTVAALTYGLGRPPLWLFVALMLWASSTNGVIAANCTALGLARNPQNLAGAAASLMGAVQFLAVSFVPSLTSLGGTATVHSVVTVMACAATLAALAFFLLTRPRTDETASTVG